MKKLIALLLAVAMVFGLVACGAKEEAAAPAATEAAAAAPAADAASDAAGGDPWDNLETLVIPLYTSEASLFATDRFSDTWLGAYILDKFNIDFELIAAPADMTSFLTTALVGGDYPAVFTTTDLNVIASYRDAGTLICLDDYQDQLSTFYAAMGEDNINMARSVSADGKAYMWYMNTPQGATMQLSYTNLNSWTARADQLEEYGLENMPYTYDEWLEFFKAMQAAHPTAPDGTPAYAMTFAGAEGWGVGSPFQGGATFDGIHSMTSGAAAFNTQTNQFEVYYTSESAKACAKFFNDLYKAGCLDPECFTLMDGDVAEKAANGYVYAFTVANWNDSAINASLETVYGDANHAVMQVPFGSADQQIRTLPVGYNNYLAATDKLQGEDLNRFLALLDWFHSEEGQLMYGSGEEGVDYEWQDGKRVPIGKFAEEIANGFAEGYAYTRGTYECYTLCNVLGSSWADCAKDGQPYRLNKSAAIATELGTTDYQKSIYEQLGWSSYTSWWVENTYRDPNVVTYGMVNMNSEEAEYDAGYVTCPDIAKNYAAKLCFADDFEATWAEFVAALENAGVNEFIDAMNAKYDALK